VLEAETQASLRAILRVQRRVLTLRASRDELDRLGSRHLLLGLAITWIVGVGRHWDHTNASWLQHLGFGSIAYVFVLSGFLWLVLWPLRPRDWSYRNLLTFVTLTAAPAILYAVPVERWMTLNDARTTNAWFLAAVASWRIAMLASYLRVRADLRGLTLFVGLLLPLSLIVTALASLNLDRAVFDLMAGYPERAGTPDDAAYGILVTISTLSMFLSPLLAGSYGLIVWFRRTSSPRSDGAT
jgi:hypothetical protein